MGLLRVSSGSPLTVLIIEFDPMLPVHMIRLNYFNYRSQPPPLCLQEGKALS